MTELRDLLDAYAGESGAVKPDDGIMREQCARRAFTALRAVLDAMDLVTELMPKGTPAVPVSVLRGMITRALTDDGVVTIDPALPHTAVDCPGRMDVTTASDETAQFVHGRCPWLDRQGAVSVEGVLDSEGPIPPTGQDRPLGDAPPPFIDPSMRKGWAGANGPEPVVPWTSSPGPELLDTRTGRVVRAVCPCLTWAVTDIRTAVYPNGHHEACDGTGHRKDQS